MVLGETCKMAATSAERRKVATLGAGRGDWWCIGTSLDALGAGGASPPPAPTSRMVLAPCAGLSGGRLPPLSATAGRETSPPVRPHYPNVCTRVYAEAKPATTDCQYGFRAREVIRLATPTTP